ncbi:MAG TPA: DUF6249 domain-containing protein [Bacteroidales bacterium]|nr:DUF6249 domain-containing protein [Bacteroidales bacterium]
METAIVFIALFAGVFGIMYLYYTTRHKERLALIDKGADASLFNTGKERGNLSFSWNKFTLKVGMFLMGIGLGVIAGALFSSMSVLDEGASYVSMIFLCGGLSLVLYYAIFDRKVR